VTTPATKVKCAIPCPNWRSPRVLIFPISRWARRWLYHWVCDEWPVRLQTYGHLLRFRR